MIGPDGFTRLAGDAAYDRLHGVDGYAQAVTPRHAPEALTAERVSDWRDRLQLLHDLARGHDYADAKDLAAGEDAIAEVCDVLTGVANQVAEQWNALEMARKADAAERRAEEAEFHVEQLRDARDRAEAALERLQAAADTVGHQAMCLVDPCDCWMQDLGPLLEYGGQPDCPALCEDHHWLWRPESDTRECLICGTESAGA